MTFSNQTNRVSAVGTGAAQTVSFSFPINANSDITVTQRITATGVESDLDETTHYTVVNNGVLGGSITTVDPFVATSAEVHIIRDTPMTQALDLTTGGDFSSTDIEAAIDKNTKLIIENNDTMSRVLKLPITDPASLNSEISDVDTRKGKYLAFHSTTGAVAVVAATDLTATSITDYGTGIVEVADEAAFKAYVNLEIGTDVQASDAGLLSIAALTTAANKMIYTTAHDTYAVAALTAFAREILDDADGATARATLGVVLGTDVQAFDAELLAIAGLTSAANKIPYFTGDETAGLLDFRDQDDMAADSASSVASQQSIKAYIDAYIRLHDSKATTTHGGTFTTGAWQKRTVTEDMDIGSHCAVTGSVIVLDAGTYDCHIVCPAFRCNTHQARLRNTSAGTTILIGTNAAADGAASTGTNAIIKGRFTIAGAQNIEIQHRCFTTRASNGLGSANSFGEAEIYTVAEFWKR